MILFLLGHDSKEKWDKVEKALRVRYPKQEIIHLDAEDPKADRTLLSLLGQCSGFLGDDTYEFIVVFTSKTRWFLDDPSLATMFETLGGVVFTDSTYSFGTIKERERQPSIMKENYDAFPIEDLEGYSNFIGTHLEYNHDRARSIHEITGEGYYGEVSSSPRTVFVSEYAHDDEDGLFRHDVDFVLMLKDYLLPEHGNHVGVVALDKASDIQEVFPFSGYVALGSKAYEFIKLYMDEEIVKAGIPSPSGLKDWDNKEEILKKFARLVANVVESGTRKTSYLQL